MFKAFFKRYFFTIVLAAFGLLTAILFLTIGFWRTILIYFLMVGFAAAGFWIDQMPKVREFIDVLFSDKKGGNDGDE